MDSSESGSPTSSRSFLCLCLSLAAGRAEAIAFIHRFPDPFPLLGRHIPTSSAETAAAGAARPAMPQSTKQNPAQRQQPQRLPEGKHSPAKQRWQQPVPEAHHHFATDESKHKDSNNRQRSNPI